MYHYVKAVARKKGYGARWLEVDLGDTRLSTIDEEYDSVKLGLRTFLLVGGTTFDISNLPSDYRMSPLTVNEWLLLNGDKALPGLVPGLPGITVSSAVYADAFAAGYAVKPGDHAVSRDTPIPKSTSPDLCLTKSGLDHRLVGSYCMALVNGFYHPVVASESEAWVLGGQDSCSRTGENLLGLVSYRNLGMLEYIPLTPSMIYRQNDVPTVYTIRRWYDSTNPKEVKFSNFDPGGLLNHTWTDGRVKIKRFVAEILPDNSRISRVLFYPGPNLDKLSVLTVSARPLTFPGVDKLIPVTIGDERLLRWDIPDQDMGFPSMVGEQLLVETSYASGTVPLPPEGLYLRDRAFIDLGVDLTNKTVFMVVGGYLVPTDPNLLVRVGGSCVSLQVCNLDVVNRYFEARNHLDFSGMKLSAMEGSPSVVSKEELLSDEALTGYLTCLNSFAIVIDNPDVVIESRPLRNAVAIPGTYIAYTKPGYVLVKDTGRAVNYWTTYEDGQWGVSGVNTYRNNRVWETTPASYSGSIRDNRDTQMPVNNSPLYELHVESDRVTSL